MNTLDQLRDMLPAGAVVECVENTYIPARDGTRRTITKAGKSVCECEMGGQPYRMSLPTRVSDVLLLDVAEGRFTMSLAGPKAPPRLQGHTASYRVIR